MLDTSEMITFTENLIEEIKHFPILYDRKVMHAKEKIEKEEAWISLTGRLPTNLRIKVDDTKKRWRTLKDCYSKYLRSFRTSNKFEARYQSWRWSEHMNYFKPFMLHKDSSDGCRGTFKKNVDKIKYNRRVNDYQTHKINNKFKCQTNIDIKHDVLVKTAQVNMVHSQGNSIKGEIDEVDDETYQAIASAISDYGNTSEGWDELINEPDNEKIVDNSTSKSTESIYHGDCTDPLEGRHFDDIDLTFLGYARSIKKLTPRRQSVIKFAVAKLIMREELGQQNENENNCLYNTT